MTPWHDCAPSHSRPDGAVVAGSTHRATHRPRQLAPSQSARGASCLPPTNSARHGHRGPPSSGLCGHLTPPSSPSIGIWPGPFAFPYPSSLVSTTGTSRFGGFGLSRSREPVRQPEPIGLARAVSTSAVANSGHQRVVPVGRPVPPEIVQKMIPIPHGHIVFQEVADWERKRMVNAH